MDLKEKTSTYEDGPHGGASAPDPTTTEGGEVQKRKADTELKKVHEAFAEVFEGVELPGDFATKAEGILEALVKEHVDAARDAIQEDADQRVSDVADQLEESFTKSADRYLEFVAERWMKENKLAVVSEAKVATATSIVEGLVELLGKHNLKIEESTYDKVAELETALAESNARYSAVAEELIEANSKVATLMAESTLRDVQEGMVLTDAEKLASLVEGFDKSDLGKYRIKVEAVKESHFGKAEVVADKGNELFEEFKAPVDDKPARVSMTESLKRYM